MKKCGKKLTVVSLAVVIGLNIAGYPVHAQEDMKANQQSSFASIQQMGSIAVTTVKDGQDIIDDSIPDNLTATYSEKLSDIALPEGWSWADPNTVLDENDGLKSDDGSGVGYYEFPAHYDVSRYVADGYDFTGVEGYDQESGIVTLNLEVLVVQKVNPIKIEDGFTLDKTYDGKPVSITEDNIEKEFDVGTISFAFKEEKISNHGTVYWGDLEEAPTKAGKYQLTVWFDGGKWYAADWIKKEFTISKADTTVSFIQDNIDKEYDGQPVFVGTEQKGNSNVAVKSWYQLDEDGNWLKLEKAPVNAGKYKVVATVDADDNYNSAETEMGFEITKAMPDYTLPSDLIIKQGEVLSSLVLPEGFTWNDSTQTADTLGMQTFKATFTPEDTTNYQTIEVEIPVEVISGVSTSNRVPEITAEDKTLKVGDTFNALADVSVFDKEDGDLTDKIEVLENNVDTSKPGIYKVTYKVTDSQGASATKTIKVTVKEKAGTQVPNKGETGQNDTTDKKNITQTVVKTGDNTNLFMWLTFSIFSAVGILSIVLLRRKK